MILDFLRIDRWLRPERSGAIAVLTAYMLLCGWGEINAWSGEGGTPSLLCTVAPFCPQCLRQPEVKPRESEPERIVTRVYFGKGLKVAERKKHLGCLIQGRWLRDHVVFIEDHYPFGDPTCMADFPDHHNVWHSHPGFGYEWRWCWIDSVGKGCPDSEAAVREDR